MKLRSFRSGAAGLAQSACGLVARTYRSHDPDDNTFRPFRGPRADCISPYS